jgi:hypothetical protein
VDAAPILFYTQSKALTSMLGDISRNFESLFEAPEMLAFLDEVLFVTEAAEDVFKELKGVKIFDRVIIALKLLIGGYFAYIFAIKPFFELLPELFDKVKVLPQKKYEATTTFEGDVTELQTHEESFVNYVRGNLPVDDIVSYKATFHTECMATITNQYIVRVLGEMAGILQARGAIPSVSDGWKLLPLSFVVDWFLDISELITGAENYFKSYDSQIDTIGHSVSIEVIMRDGQIYNCYIRSDNNTRALDPPGEVWLTPSGAPALIAIPLAIIVGLGLSGK